MVEDDDLSDIEPDYEYENDDRVVKCFKRSDNTVIEMVILRKGHVGEQTCKLPSS